MLHEIERLMAAVQAHLEYETGSPRGSAPEMLEENFDRMGELRAALADCEAARRGTPDHEVFVVDAKERLYRRLPLSKPVCPVCDRKAILARRTLSKFMARFLLSLRFRTINTGEQWHTTRECLRTLGEKSSTDGTYLRLWGFIEPGPSAFQWGITDSGLAFAEGRQSAPRAHFVYNNQSRWVEEERIFIREALTVQFNYEDMLSGNYFLRRQMSRRGNPVADNDPDEAEEDELVEAIDAEDDA